MFFGAELQPAGTLAVAATTRLSHATLIATAPPSEAGGVSLHTADGLLVCHLTERAPHSTLRHVVGAVVLRCRGPATARVHVCGRHTTGATDGPPHQQLALPARPLPPLPEVPQEAEPQLTGTDLITMELAGDVARHLLLSRKACLLARAAGAEAVCAALDAVVDAARRMGQREGASAKAQRALDDVATAATEACKLWRAPAARLSADVQLRTLMRIDTAYFGLLHLLVSSTQFSFRAMATGGAAEPSGAALLREPSRFFMASHSERWVRKQQARLFDPFRPSLHSRSPYYTLRWLRAL